MIFERTDSIRRARQGKCICKAHFNDMVSQCAISFAMISTSTLRSEIGRKDPQLVGSLPYLSRRNMDAWLSVGVKWPFSVESWNRLSKNFFTEIGGITIWTSHLPSLLTDCWNINCLKKVAFLTCLLVLQKSIKWCYNM